MPVNQHYIPIALVVAGTLGLAANAQAQVYAVAYNNVVNLSITSTNAADGGGPFFIPLTDFTDFSVVSGASAQYNGIGDPANPANSDTQGGPADALPAFGLGSNFPGSAPANNAMGPLGQLGTGFSRSDAQVSQTALLQPVIGGPITPTLQTTQAWNIAEAYVASAGHANSAALNSSETGMNTTITLNQPARIAFSFDADPYMQVNMGALAAGGTANADLEVTFTLTSGGTTIFEWGPDGQPGGITGGEEFVDEGNLNGSIEVTSPGDSAIYNPTGDLSAGVMNPGTRLSYSARTNVLPAGVYTLSLDMLEIVNVRTALAPVIYDLGDNPDAAAGTGQGNYQTRQADGGARHTIAGPFLGSCVDADNGTLQNAAANADDSTPGTTIGTCAGGGDEDGVTLPASVMPGGDYTATINMPGGASIEDCAVDGWIDFNADGDFLDVGEYIVAQTFGAGSGATDVNFTVPMDAASGTLYSRFRCSRNGGLAATGDVDNGEVEDYPITQETVKQRVPTMGTWGLILLSLGLCAIAAMRRQQLRKVA